jgi:hydrogenase nickel incorporation protein HypB
MLLNKMDLVPHLEFDPQRCTGYARQVNPRLTILPLSATRGDGLDPPRLLMLRAHPEIRVRAAVIAEREE